MKKITQHFRTTLTIAILILAISAINAAAATFSGNGGGIFTVTNTNDSGAGSLRQAIADANATAAGADTIVFSSLFNTAQTIQLASGIPNYNSADPLTITGPGSNLLTIRGNDTFRIFTLTTNSIVTLSGLTITNGRDTFFGGGGIYKQFGTLSITNVVVTANSGNGGGGIQLFNGATLNAVNSTISNNTVTGEGGGISAIQSSTINLTNTTVGGNMAGGNGGGIVATDGVSVTTGGSSIISNNSSGDRGGGIYFSGAGTFQMTDTTVSGNSAVQGGGGIHNSGTATITNCTISNNSSAGGGFAQGGGINNIATLTVTGSTVSGNTSNRLGAGIFSAANGATTLTITNSTISNSILNTTQGFDGGGGLFLGGNDTATITNSTISGNTVTTTSSVGNGGGIYAGGTLTLTNSTLANNSAAFDGGGLYHPTGNGNTVNLRNSIVADNTANRTAPDIFGTVNSNGFNLIENLMGATITGTTSTNITGQDPMLGPLADNGGMTFTHALLAGSPAIDQGESSGATTDQRGFQRPVDNPSIANASGGDGADIGAFEVQAPTAASVSISGRVLTDRGRGLRNAFVVMTDQNGSTRTARTSAFGYYCFEDVAAGETYIMSVQSKRYYFTPQVISATENLTGLNFTVYPQFSQVPLR